MWSRGVSLGMLGPVPPWDFVSVSQQKTKLGDAWKVTVITPYMCLYIIGALRV